MTMWVFGYGSLLWNPGFTPVDTMRARLDGYHRSFCMLSVHHRGTEDEPGLVLALDEKPQSDCTGLALKVAPDEEGAVLAALRERELVSSAYLEKHVTLRADDGQEITALTYVIDPAHVQYCAFAPEQKAQMISTAVGGRGPNTEYLFNTAAHLAKIGIDDPEMIWLVERVKNLIND